MSPGDWMIKQGEKRAFKAQMLPIRAPHLSPYIEEVLGAMTLL